MAANVALNAVFVHIGFSNVAATILTDATKENLKIGTLQYFDDSGIKILKQLERQCWTIQKCGKLLYFLKSAKMTIPN
jgi:hypothetical protein